jgi:hypothetical protein
MDSVTIKSTRGQRSLTFSNRNGDYFDAEIAGDGISAKKGIYGYTDTALLADLFDSLARDWKGWTEERHWASIEGELDLTASSDSLGHIRLDMVILSNHPEDNWTVTAPVYLDAGALDAIAIKVRSFFNESTQ